MPQDFGVHGKFFPLRISLFQLVEGLLQLYNLVMFRAKREITLIARERETHGDLFLRTPVAALLPARVHRNGTKTLECQPTRSSGLAGSFA